MQINFKALLAEFIGTFALVFVGALAVVVASNVALTEGGNLLGVTIAALAHGLILVALIYTFGHYSGAHFNPAVTAGLLVGGKIAVVSAVGYWVAQFLGGIVAGFAALALSAPAGLTGVGETIGLLTVDHLGTAAILEAVLTFFLVTTIYQSAVYGKGGQFAGVAIGLMLAACIFAGGVFTGASLNPARTLGPALAAGNFSYVPMYLIGIFAGGIVAGLLNAFVLKPPSEPAAPPLP
ncbi:MAG: aquaporin [Anaerolineae bacterium]|nr:aquaporin [Anaerolineae bacterium]